MVAVPYAFVVQCHGKGAYLLKCAQHGGALVRRPGFAERARQHEIT